MNIPKWWPSRNPWIIGDCIEGMLTLPKYKCDLIIADYPFNCQDERKDYVSFIKETAKAFWFLLKPDGNLVIINNPPNMFKTLNYFTSFTLRNGVVLKRPASFFPAWHLGFNHNYLYILGKDTSKKKKWNGNQVNHNKGLTDVWEYQNGYRDRYGWHPQAIPESVTGNLIELLSDEGNLILDPFLGSGTTLKMAALLGRKCLGFEINQEYEEMIRERFLTADQQTKLEDYV